MTDPKWVRLFSRLDRAVTRHREEMADSPLTAADEALYAAHRKVLNDVTQVASRTSDVPGVRHDGDI